MPKSVTATPDPAIGNADDIDQMRIAASAASALLKGVAHEDRLLLLCLLSRHELCVGEIEAQLHIRQPSLSQQLGVLRREKLVATRREGKRIFYRIADQKALALVTLLYDLYCRVDH
ncbi:MAG: ArsR family transcriptional regulator [Porticoccus sp.]|jgi:ArsR family transcriptional regulator|uniref:metalloregulator ArsR/SmtB family transcription factor n=1 Tax=Porticoccus sp. TaxID=2024853 RepID=UPI0039E43EBA